MPGLNSASFVPFKPAPLKLLPLLDTTIVPGPVHGCVAEPAFRLQSVGNVPPKVVCGFSSERPNVKSSPTVLVMRSCGLRVHTKPGTYCASIVGGASSLRSLMPLASSVASDQL